MSSQMFVDSNAFSPNSVVFNAPKTNKAGGKNVTLTDSSIRKQLAIATPLMLTWGMNEFRDEATGKVSYDLSPIPMPVPCLRSSLFLRIFARRRQPRSPRSGLTSPV